MDPFSSDNNIFGSRGFAGIFSDGIDVNSDQNDGNGNVNINNVLLGGELGIYSDNSVDQGFRQFGGSSFNNYAIPNKSSPLASFSGSQYVPCSRCIIGKACYSCLTCQDLPSLCSACEKTHTDTFGGHAILPCRPKSDMMLRGNDSHLLSCGHQFLGNGIVCDTCSMKVCMDCVANHQDHNIYLEISNDLPTLPIKSPTIGPDDMYAMVNSNINEAYNQLDRLHAAHAKMEEQRNVILADINIKHKEIDKDFNNLLAHIVELQKIAHMELESNGAKLMLPTQLKLKEVLGHINSAEHDIEIVNSLLQSGTNVFSSLQSSQNILRQLIVASDSTNDLSESIPKLAMGLQRENIASWKWATNNLTILSGSIGPIGRVSTNTTNNNSGNNNYSSTPGFSSNSLTNPVPPSLVLNRTNAPLSNPSQLVHPSTAGKGPFKPVNVPVAATQFNNGQDSPTGLQTSTNITTNILANVIHISANGSNLAASPNVNANMFIRGPGFIGEGKGTGIGQLQNPSGIGIYIPKEDNASEMYAFVADYNNHRIQVYDAITGVFYRSIGFGKGSSPGQLQNPTGLAMFVPATTDKATLVYVADHNNHRIQIFNAMTGAILQSIGGGKGSRQGQLQHPYGLSLIETDGKRLLFVAEYDNHRVQVFDAISGAYLRTYGGRGNAPHHMQCPAGVCSFIKADGHVMVYVADSANHRIQVYDDTTGTYLGSIGNGRGTGLGQLKNPLGCSVFVSPSGEAYLIVSEYDNHRLQVFNAISGRPIKIIGAGQGSNIGQMRGPWSVAMAPCFSPLSQHTDHQCMFVSEFGNNHRIQVFVTHFA